jgi:hypothetical protein
VVKIKPKVWEARHSEDKPGEGVYYSCAIFEVELPILNSVKGELVKVLYPTEKLSHGLWVKETGEEYLLFLVSTDDLSSFFRYSPNYPSSYYEVMGMHYGFFRIKNDQTLIGGIPWKCFAKEVLEYLASQ